MSIESFILFITTYKYPALFVGLIIGGETFLMPAVFLATTGQLSLWSIYVIAMIATSLSDSVWYLIGVYLPKTRLARIKMITKQKEKTERFSELFRKNYAIFLFASKFIYGTRIAAQLLCGINKIKFWKYFAINMLGIVSWISFLAIIAYSLNVGTVNELLDKSNPIIDSTVIIFIVFIIIVLISNLIIKKIAEKKWFQQ